MIRTIAIASLLTTTIALPGFAQDIKKMDPGTKNPTGAVGDQVPNMKGDGTSSGTAVTPNATMGAATPSLKPDQSASTSSVGSIILSEQDAKNWIGKPVYSKDQKKIGEVDSFRRGPGGEILGLNAGIGGFLGLGETRVMASPSQFKLQSDRVILDVLADEAKNLPKVQ
jgi:hypothetical protein